MAFYIRYRFITSFVLWFALITYYVLRSNLSVAVIAMNAKRINVSRKIACPVEVHDVLKIKEDGPFDWDDVQIGTVLSAFFYGYMVANLLGAFAASLIGPRYTLIISLAGSTLFTFLIIPMSYAGYEVLVVGRLIIGIFSGPGYPVTHLMIGRWSRMEERTAYAIITHTGNIAGLILNFAVGAYLCNYDVDGWKYFIYFSGGMGLLALALWTIFCYDQPWKHPFISETEKKSIIASLYPNGIPLDKNQLKNVPFISMLKSKNVWLLGISHFSCGFYLYMFLTGFTKFLSDVYGHDVETASYLTIIPFVANFIFQIAVSFISNYIISKKILSVTYVRKIVTFISFFFSCILIIPAGFLNCNQEIGSIILLTIVCGFVGLSQAGYFVGMIDIAPKFAGYTLGFANIFGGASGIISPQVSGVFVDKYGTKDGYKYLFILTALVSFLLVVFWLIFGTCEKRVWADYKVTYKVNSTENTVSSEDN